jgi:hypothetical protein
MIVMTTHITPFSIIYKINFKSLMLDYYLDKLF